MQGVAFPQELFAAGTATTSPVVGGPSSMPVLNQPQRPPQAPATSRLEREQLCLALQRQFPELLPRYVEGFVVSTLVENAQTTRSFVHPSILVRQQGNGQIGSFAAVGSMRPAMTASNVSMNSQQAPGQALMAALSASSRMAGRATPGQGASTQALNRSAKADSEKANKPYTSLGNQQRETSLTETRITRPAPGAQPSLLASRKKPVSSSDDIIKPQNGRTKLAIKAPNPNSGHGTEKAPDPAAKSASKQLRDHLDHNFATFLDNGKQASKKKKRSNVVADDETFQPEDDEIDEDYMAMTEQVHVPESEEDTDYKPSKSSEKKKKTPKNQPQRRGYRQQQ